MLTLMLVLLFIILRLPPSAWLEEWPCPRAQACARRDRRAVG
jgi:hypothetical protein